MGKTTKPREDVSRFLDNMKSALSISDRMLTIVPRPKNDAFRIEEGLRTNQQVIGLICKLETEHYMYNDDEPKWHVFSLPYTTVEGTGIYVFIRIMVQEQKGMVVCLSLHPAEFDPRPSLIYRD